MADCPQTVGKAAIQALFVEIEDVSGELQPPTSTGFVLPAGDATMTQTPTFEASAEKSKSLNVTEQFQNAVDAGSVSIPSYIRLADNFGAPQGDALLQALMGDVQASDAVAAELDETVTASDVTLTVSSATGFFPPRGVVTVGTEQVHYKYTDEADGVYTLSGCTRGYNGTTAAAHTAEDEVKLTSRVYLQSICRPTVSVWLQLDHTVMFMRGCSVSAAEFPLSNSGGQMMTYTLQGRQLGWVGQGTIGSLSGAVITLEDEDGHFAYTEGGYVYNATKSDNNSDSGYKITAVDEDNNTITVTPTPTTWAADDVLKPWLPTGTAVGTPTESRKLRLFAAGASGIPESYKQREGTLSISTPIEFGQEIGDYYPSESADGTREITVSGGLYFRAEDAALIGKGFQGNEERLDICSGDKAGKTLSFVMPRTKFNTPETGVDGLFLVLTQNGTALGDANVRDGESSLYVVIE